MQTMAGGIFQTRVYGFDGLRQSVRGPIQWSHVSGRLESGGLQTAMWQLDGN